MSCPKRKLSPATLSLRAEPGADMVMWCRVGRAEVMVRGRPVVIEAGDAILVPSGIEHSVVTDHDTVILPVALATAGHLRERGPGAGWSVVRGVSPAVEALFLAAHVDSFNAIRIADAERWGLHAQVRAAFAPPACTFSAASLHVPAARSSWLGHGQDLPVLLWCVSGGARVTFAAKSGAGVWEIRLGADQAVTVPAGVVHRTRTERGGVVLPVFGLHDSEVSSVGLRHVPARSRAEAMFWEAGWASELSPEDRVWAQTPFPVGPALSDLAVEPLPEGTAAWRVQRVKRALHHDPGYRANLDSWASQFGVTTRSMRMAFDAHSELGYAEFRQELRMQRAKSWLDEGRQAKWVSHRLGFEHAAAFSKAFRHHEGMSIRDYQADGRENALLLFSRR